MNDDWRDLLSGFRAVEARFLIIGAHAMAVHGVPRGTQDIDIWIEPTEENAQLIWAALSRFGAPLVDLGISREDLRSPEKVIQLGLPPHRIDLLSSVSGSRISRKPGPTGSNAISKGSPSLFWDARS